MHMLHLYISETDYFEADMHVVHMKTETAYT